MNSRTQAFEEMSDGHPDALIPVADRASAMSCTIEDRAPADGAIRRAPRARGSDDAGEIQVGTAQKGEGVHSPAVQFSLRTLFFLTSGAAVLLAALAAAGASASQSLIGIAAISMGVLAASATERVVVAWFETLPDDGRKK